MTGHGNLETFDVEIVMLIDSPGTHLGRDSKLTTTTW